MKDIEITPTDLQLKSGAEEVYWSETSDLADMVRMSRDRFPRMPGASGECEGGLVLVGLAVDGTFDEVVVSLPTGADRAELAEQMLSVSSIADDVGRALDSVMSRQPVRRSTRELLRAQAQQFIGANNLLTETVDLLQTVADDGRCPIDVCDAAKAAVERITAAADALSIP